MEKTLNLLTLLSKDMNQLFLGFPCGSGGKESACNAGDLDSIPGLGRFPWRRERLLTPIFLPWRIPWTV